MQIDDDGKNSSGTSKALTEILFPSLRPSQGSNKSIMEKGKREFPVEMSWWERGREKTLEPGG